MEIQTTSNSSLTLKKTDTFHYLLIFAFAFQLIFLLANCSQNSTQRDSIPAYGDNDQLEQSESDNLSETDADIDEREQGEMDQSQDGDSDPIDADMDVEEEERSERDSEVEEVSGDFVPSLSIVVPEVMGKGRSQPIFAIINDDNDTGTRDVSSVSEWVSFNPDILTFSEDKKQLVAIEEGEAMIQAHYGSVYTEMKMVQVLPANRVEARGIWVNRWSFSSEADVRDIIRQCADAGFNQVYFQVRGVFDAYYSSTLEPWARGLSGSPGGDPGWDPLQVAIAAAHENGIELHAWINVFTVWQGDTRPSESRPRHMLLEHPEWVLQNEAHQAMGGSGYIWANPGNPDVRAHNVAVVRDIISHYAVDGIHLDRIRYPDSIWGYNPQSEALYEQDKAEFPDWSFEDWRREQVISQVGEIYEAINEVNPDVVLSAAVAGIYTDEWSWGGVTEGYHKWLQDWRAFADRGLIDIVVPMVYWQTRETYAAWTDFRALVDDHAQKRSRALYIGSDLRKSSDAEGRRTVGNKVSFESFEEMKSQVNHTRQRDTQGWVLYDWGDLQTTGYTEQFTSELFSEKAVVPFMYWKSPFWRAVYAQ